MHSFSSAFVLSLLSAMTQAPNQSHELTPVRSVLATIINEHNAPDDLLESWAEYTADYLDWLYAQNQEPLGR